MYIREIESTPPLQSQLIGVRWTDNNQYLADIDTSCDCDHISCDNTSLKSSFWWKRKFEKITENK